MKKYYYILSLFSMTILLSPVNLCGEDSSSFVLVEGTAPRSGVPGFGPNAIVGLYGKYLGAASSSEVDMWAVHDSVVFSKALWADARVGDFKAFYSDAEKGKKIWAIPRNLAVREKTDVPTRWVFVVRFSDTVPDDECKVFADAAIRRTESFFVAARRFSDLSFPAILNANRR